MIEDIERVFGYFMVESKISFCTKTYRCNINNFLENWFVATGPRYFIAEILVMVLQNRIHDNLGASSEEFAD